MATKIQSEVNFIWLKNAISTHLIGKKIRSLTIPSVGECGELQYPLRFALGV